MRLTFFVLDDEGFVINHNSICIKLLAYIPFLKAMKHNIFPTFIFVVCSFLAFNET